MSTGTKLRELTDTAHRDEVARARQVARIEQLQAKAIEELGIDPEVLMEDFGAPQQPIPFIAGPDHEGELPEPGSFVREDREEAAAPRGAWSVRPWSRQPTRARGVRRARGAPQVPRRAVGGPQRSPSATCSTSSKRSTSASRRSSPRPTTTRRPLRARLRSALPRRSGPARAHRSPDMLTTGIEVEARPPGKKVKRLSLLSGGERPWSPSPCWCRSSRPAEPVLHHGRGRGSPRRHQPGPPHHPLRGCGRTANSSSSPTRRRRWRSPTRSTA